MGFADEMNRAFESSEEMKFETIGAYLKLFLIACNGSVLYSPITIPRVSRSDVRLFSVSRGWWNSILLNGTRFRIMPRN